MTHNAETLSSLKQAMDKAITAESTNFDEILRLASEISRLEPGVVRFSTDAAMVRRLGRELVAKQETALGELVKNAYDADATFCEVSLLEQDGAETFDIVDDGNGMTYRNIADGFMRLASDAKVVEPVSPRFGRARAGRKGIGRFATERLGNTLTIVTQTEHENHGWTVTVDWAQFAQGTDISSIRNAIRPSAKERPRGTRLNIGGLWDTWTDTDLRRVYRYLATLIEPTIEQFEPQPGTSKPGSFASKLASETYDADQSDESSHGLTGGDPGFVPRMTRGRKQLEEPQVVASLNTEILGQALATIEATIDQNGGATWSMTCNRYEIDLKQMPVGLDRNRPGPLSSARNVRMRAWYYIRSSEFLGHSTSFIREVLDERGGIRLYRNGYRVPPYGERDNDWLSLDRKRSGTYAPINRKVFLGYVALTDPSSEIFEETSSREGLIDVPALHEVRDLMSQVLEAAVRRIESVRGLGRRDRRKQDASSGERAANAVETATTDLRDAVDEQERGDVSDPVTRDKVVVAAMRLATVAQQVVEVARERDELLQELSLLRILASMGLTVAEFTHDFSHLADTMELNLDAFSVAAEFPSPEIEQQLGRFRRQFRQVRAYTGLFGSMVANNAIRELRPIDLYAFARSFAEDLGVMFERRGLELRVERPREYDIRTIEMHSSEWSSILLNLLTNSIKAVHRAGRAGRFLLRVGRIDPSRVFLDFSDNGDGILEQNRPRIFDAFFTTASGSAAQAPGAVQAIGTGLGLKIVRDIVTAVGGEVNLSDPPDGFVTCIRVTVPANATTTETAT